MTLSVPQWLTWAREIQALGQSGLAYSHNDYDRERYARLMELAAEIVERYSGLPKEATLRDFTLQPGYATPKIDVRGAVVRDGRILLVQERTDGRWSMPGGWTDVGKTPAEMVVREVWEESGYHVQARKIVAVYDANRITDVPLAFFHAYKIIFLCELTGGEARTSIETLAVDWFRLARPSPALAPTHQ